MKRIKRRLLRTHARFRFFKLYGWGEYRDMCQKTMRYRRRPTEKGVILADFWDVHDGTVVKVHSSEPWERLQITFTSWPLKPDYETGPTDIWTASVRVKRPNVDGTEPDSYSLLYMELMGKPDPKTKLLSV